MLKGCVGLSRIMNPIVASLLEFTEAFEIPKAIICVKDFIQTYSGKIKRKASMDQKPQRILNL